MAVLITGAGGMVGSHMAEIMAWEGIEVIGTYYKPTVDMCEISDDIKMIECDVRYPKNIEKIIKHYMPDQIYHLAAQSYPTVSWDKPYETMDINIGGTIAVFETIKEIRKDCPHYNPVVIVACSSAEYGQTLEEMDNEKVKESVQLKPLHPYGVSKVGQDLLAYQYFANDGIRTIRARIFNTTGTRKRNDVTSDFTKRAIEQLYVNCENPVLSVGNINTERAIMDVKDLIAALRALAEKGKAGEVYNISSEKVYKISDIIHMIENELKIQFQLHVDKKLLRPTDERIIVGDVEKLKKDTGWEQRVNLEQTVKEMLEYWKCKYKKQGA
ncbi:GDP-mannose 4,6-dehydratase [Lachnospiraceae bacterium]|uniref:GDP-mannose 4,6-dehydratase n=1 Tax=Extibacter sp. GGCC_0201 TaxID=2731209 RepID=UPI001AA10AF6|nr:GDP-mannose 4,6-dehydratase [Extibacter sp. GGCC_0201]MBO1721996.1 NAD-dependent epimerase/dehydratase family protein [Extibacter sp. GGCC_0201]BDF35174.1 GDP-mannose 4,6-dehydratase [Lachnospiraceae bacterium]BDF39175.1 GDP-mannose 4,6-dehydratase [Lachnospiraceae bacterium]